MQTTQRNVKNGETEELIKTPVHFISVGILLARHRGVDWCEVFSCRLTGLLSVAREGRPSHTATEHLNIISNFHQPPPSSHLISCPGTS